MTQWKLYHLSAHLLHCSDYAVTGLCLSNKKNSIFKKKNQNLNESKIHSEQGASSCLEENVNTRVKSKELKERQPHGIPCTAEETTSQESRWFFLAA